MRHWRQALSVLALACAAAGLTSHAAASSVGSEAPELTPREWLNHNGPISWASLKGRVILVEKWATT